jgi:hypothetical protein
MIAPPSGAGGEEIVVNLILWLKLTVEAMGTTNYRRRHGPRQLALSTRIVSARL